MIVAQQIANFGFRKVLKIRGAGGALELQGKCALPERQVRYPRQVQESGFGLSHGAIGTFPP
jgi:hypothetical protein